MQKINFIKMHGLGNDFVIVFSEEIGFGGVTKDSLPGTIILQFEHCASWSFITKPQKSQSFINPRLEKR